MLTYRRIAETVLLSAAGILFVRGVHRGDEASAAIGLTVWSVYLACRLIAACWRHYKWFASGKGGDSTNT
jgi:hypothetical protein